MVNYTEKMSLISRIIEQDSLWNDPKNALSAICHYLENGNGSLELDLDQYLTLRDIVDKKYKKNVSRAVKEGRVSKSEVNRVGKLFTDYIRDQHAKLVIEKKGLKERKSIQKPKSIFDRIKTEFRNTVNNFSYNFNWKDKDANSFYKLERYLLSDSQNAELERNLLRSLPTEGLSRHKINTLEKLSGRSLYKSSLWEIISSNKYYQSQLAFA